jgi:heat shock protein HslJ
MVHDPRPTLGLGAALGLVLLVGGCAGQPGPSPAEPADLLGVWTIDETFDSPEQPYVSFLDDETWSASDGCNRVQGTWQLGADGALTTTSGPQTLMACDGAQLPLAVTMADRVEIEGDVLFIHSSMDSTVTELVRSTDPLVGPQGLPVGKWVESDAEGAPFLSISADGTYSGNDGCNNFTGAWTTSDDGATEFGPAAITLMACEGVDQWLSRATLGRVVGAVMTLQAEDGTVLGQLTAQ